MKIRIVKLTESRSKPNKRSTIGTIKESTRSLRNPVQSISKSKLLKLSSHYSVYSSDDESTLLYGSVELDDCKVDAVVTGNNVDIYIIDRIGVEILSNIKSNHSKAKKDATEFIYMVYEECTKRDQVYDILFDMGLDNTDRW